MQRLSLILPVALLLALVNAGGQSAPPSAAGSPGLDEWKKQLEAVFTDLPRQERETVKTLQQRYLAGLTALEEALQAQGNAMQSLMVVRGEKERFVRSGTIPDKALSTQLPALRKLQDAWRAQTAALPLATAQKIVAATEQYLQNLAYLQKVMTASNNASGVAAVKAETERLLGNQRVLEAVALVQAEKAHPRPASSDPTAPLDPKKDAALQRSQVYLSDLPEKDAQVGYGKFGKNGDLGHNEGRIIVKGHAVSHGLSMHPPSQGSAQVTYNLSGHHTTLTGATALNDTANDKCETALKFRILGDGKELWRSKPMRQGSKEFKVLIRGVRKLELIVDCPGSFMYAHAVWVDPLLQ